MIGLPGGVNPRTKKEIGMVEQVVRLTVDLTPNEGQMEAFKALTATMTEVSKSEQGTLGYEWFASADGKQYRLVETYVNAAAIEAHFMGAAVQVHVPNMMGCASVTGFEIYGDPGQKVTEMVSGFGAAIFKYTMGIGR
jgi:quinol monooxygenase YgiN